MEEKLNFICERGEESWNRKPKPRKVQFILKWFRCKCHKCIFLCQILYYKCIFLCLVSQVCLFVSCIKSASFCVMYHKCVFLCHVSQVCLFVSCIMNVSFCVFYHRCVFSCLEQQDTGVSFLCNKAAIKIYSIGI